jgi:amino acid transporter
MPSFPVDSVFRFLTVFAVANTALINMLMASRLVYGMAKQGVLPSALGRVLPHRRSPWAGIVFTTALALVLVVVVSQLAESTVSSLAGTTGLLLLVVFGVVNTAAFVLRQDPGDEASFRAPVWAPVVGAVACLFLAGPWARDAEDWVQYQIAAGMVGLGVVLWLATWLTRRGRSAPAPAQGP